MNEYPFEEILAPLEAVMSVNETSTIGFLDVITAIMKAGKLDKVTIHSITGQPERLCVINRQALGNSPGYDIYLCESSEAAFALGDSLHEAHSKGLN